MAQPYIGEIRIFAGNYEPLGWRFCDGSLLSIAENDTLFMLIGTTYGGDGESTFALPDLRGRLPMHHGTGSGLTPRGLGETGGQERVTLAPNQTPVHGHTRFASGSIGTRATPGGHLPAASNLERPAFGSTLDVQIGSTESAGGGQPHDNMQPYLALNFIISLFGIYPSQT